MNRRANSPTMVSRVAQTTAMTPNVQSRRIRERSMAAPHNERVKNETEKINAAFSKQ